MRATAGWTLPSHVAIFGGVLARSVGLGQAPAETPQSACATVASLRDTMLPAVLGRHGYATAGATTNMWAGGHSGFDRGFDAFADLETSRQAGLEWGRRAHAKWLWEAARARADDGAAAAESVLARWTGELGDDPFFWFVNLVECHSPYLPPRPYDDSSVLTRLQAAEEARRHLRFEPVLQASLGLIEVPEAALERMRHLYAGSLRYADAWLGRVCERLDAAGALDDTLVVVCSDHGENFGEGGQLGHAVSLDDRLLRVPLVAAGPGAGAFRDMTSLAELPARVAEATGLTEHPWAEPLPAGMPVAQWDPLLEPSDPRLAELAASWGFEVEAVAGLATPLTCAVEGRFKLLRRGDREELYDLEADPLELGPLVEEGAMSARAGAALPALRRALNHPSVCAAGDAVGADVAVGAEELAEVEQRMRLMGYL